MRLEGESLIFSLFMIITLLTSVFMVKKKKDDLKFTKGVVVVINPDKILRHKSSFTFMCCVFCSAEIQHQLCSAVCHVFCIVNII